MNCCLILFFTLMPASGIVWDCTIEREKMWGLVCGSLTHLVGFFSQKRRTLLTSENGCVHALAANDDARQACPVNDKGIEKSGMGRADNDGRLFGRCLPPDNSHPVAVGSEEKSLIGC